MSAAILLANMLIDMIEGDPTLMHCAEVSNEHHDHAIASEQAGIHLRAAVDTESSASQPGEHRAPICAAGQGAGDGLATEVDPGAGSGPGQVGGTERWSRGLQDVGGGRFDGPGRSGVCSGGIAPGAVQSRLAPTAGVVCPHAHLGDRRRWLLRPCRLQRRTGAGHQGHDGPGRVAFDARAPPGRQAEQGTEG